MRSEKEIRKLLAECEDINERNDFHGPYTPCPFTGEIEACLDCTHEQALKWVLDEPKQPKSILDGVINEK